MRVEPLAKLHFCKFNEVDGLCQNKVGHDSGADGKMEAADKNMVLQLHQLFLDFHEYRK
ncbi:MAG: hypothetical protein LBH03_07515 [Holophagales bacterium]|jgi:hypothetical protein|nr:hypothetical protein [Holophagales bacterium]